MASARARTSAPGVLPQSTSRSRSEKGASSERPNPPVAKIATGVLHFATSRPAASMTIASTSRDSAAAIWMPLPPFFTAFPARSRASENARAMSKFIEEKHYHHIDEPGGVRHGKAMAEIELAPLSHRLD